MMKNRNSLTVIQRNDSHAYFDLHHEMFWLGGQAVYVLREVMRALPTVDVFEGSRSFVTYSSL